MFMAGIGPRTIHTQRDARHETVMLNAPGNGNDGLVLETRSTATVQNTTARAHGQGMPSGAPASAGARERARAFVNGHAAAFGLRKPGTPGGGRPPEIAVKQELPPDEVGLQL